MSIKQNELINEAEGKGTKRLVVFVVIGILIVTSFFAGYLAVEPQEIQELPQEHTIIDDLGRTVIVPDNPQRIISLAPSVTEILFILELDDRIVGVDDNSDYPEEAKDMEKVGGWVIDEEKVVALNPDLVLAAGITSEATVTSLEQRGLTVVGLAPKTIHGIIQDIRLVGLITNNTEIAESVATALEDRIDAVTAVTSNATLYRPTAYLEYYPYWTFGPGSFGNELILMAGGRNIAANTTTAYPNISDEYIVGSNPDTIIFTVGLYTTTTVDNIKDRPGWDTTDAVSNDMIYTIDDNIVARSGPRIVDALEELAHLLHPDLFP